YPYLIIFNGGRIYVRDETKESRFDVRDNKMFSEINHILVGSVNGTLFTDKGRFISYYLQSTSRYLVKLKPMSPVLRTYLSEIRLFFDKNDHTVSEIEMIEPSGDNTRIRFTGKVFNQPVSDDKFDTK
ncbi:MAG TPA: outer membrane lipoprotein carrier protein LolA, partial [Bacteroidales bacterium]|nr:outer membrane lipoprotein carrier protein LolA [Bacteroidales bacterium]